LRERGANHRQIKNSWCSPLSRDAGEGQGERASASRAVVGPYCCFFLLVVFDDVLFEDDVDLDVELALPDFDDDVDDFEPLLPFFFE
jgi:hypothetical protein